ncbi:MAG TPA: hypothetical protein VGO40_19705 [Longimicrobium sp.]|nr:hypothetical protein [Longimicrobium sp.]
MSKLRLNVDALQVQSFLTTDEHGQAPGTVEGYDSGRPPGATRQQSCPGFEATCPVTCDDYTCAGFTCYGDSCDYTCHTNVCACELSDFGSCIC